MFDEPGDWSDWYTVGLTYEGQVIDGNNFHPVSKFRLDLRLHHPAQTDGKPWSAGQIEKAHAELSQQIIAAITEKVGEAVVAVEPFRGFG